VTAHPPIAEKGVSVGRVIGLDISKHSAQVAVLQPGTGELQHWRFAAQPAAIRRFADQLGPDDRVALESCTNAFAFHRLLCQHAGQVVVSNPLKTRVIAEAKVKTDKVDAEILAQLLAADFLPPVWVPDAATDQLRHGVSHPPRPRTASMPSCTATSSLQTSPTCSAKPVGSSWLRSSSPGPSANCSRRTCAQSISSRKRSAPQSRASPKCCTKILTSGAC